MDRICAGIVLYNPDIELLNSNISHIVNQVEQLFLYDNCSLNIEAIEELLDVNFTNKCVLLKGTENKGIAYALNRLLDNAKSEGFDWILTMDQDSICSDTMIMEYRKYMHMGNGEVGILCPFILNNNKISFDEYKLATFSPYEYVYDWPMCITSGSLTNISAALNVGGFNESLFIDYVDTEFNMKLNQKGYSIIRVNSAYMFQQMGVGRKVPVFDWLFRITKSKYFRKLRYVSVYNDFRLYHIFRNSHYLRLKYEKVQFYNSAVFTFLLAGYYSLTYPLNRNRFKMWQAMFKGYRDAYKLIAT